MDTIRSFFAIDLSLDLINEFKMIIHEIDNNSPPIIKWVDRKNQHLTLKFIGNLKSVDIEPIRDLLNKEIANISKFSITIARLGVFPSTSRPRVIWIGIEESLDLLKVYLGIEYAITAMGYPKEKRHFSPHITLGRVRRYSKPYEINNLKTFLRNFNIGKIGELEIEEINLYKSILKPTGPIYSKVFSLMLGQLST
ncbi:MAG TPA: RNA 2',3'-cyclic phosphodiesterase [Anaerolineae bacterium]|nr:RNA 2',3'-cyclic phosphodiesterase [Anaerolineae bacterium]